MIAYLVEIILKLFVCHKGLCGGRIIRFQHNFTVACPQVFQIVISLVLPYATKEPLAITSQGFINKDLFIPMRSVRR